MVVEPWIKALPPSKMVYPDEVHNRIKYWVWRVYTPVHPYLRNISMQLGLRASMFAPMETEGRQDYLLGKLDPNRTLSDFIRYLLSQGYGNHFVAWKDDGELVSLRKTNGFKYQYHLRVFDDGEVRVHYEYTPEYRPLQHLIQIGFENRIAEFEELTKGWVVPTT